MSKVLIFILILFLFSWTELGRTIGIRNYILGNITGGITCYFTLKGKYDGEKLIRVLDSYEIFDYRLLLGTRLVRMKPGKKSYDIGGSERTALLSIRVDQTRYDDYTLNITFHHGVFDMQYIMEILDAYLRNDSSPKPLRISKSVYLSDVEPSTLKPSNYIRSVVLTREKIIVSKEDIHGFRATGLSSLDIVFAILARKYLMEAGKSSFTLSIIKSTRTQQNDRSRIGNMVTFHNVAIRSGRVRDIADRIRKSYSEGTAFAPADVVITSWVPHKGLSHLYGSIKSNGRVDTGFRPRLYHSLYHQQISVSKSHDDFLCDIHRSRVDKTKSI